MGLPNAAPLQQNWRFCLIPQGVTAKLKALLEAEKELGKSTKIE
jgi:hypothetical protein